MSILGTVKQNHLLIISFCKPICHLPSTVQLSLSGFWTLTDSLLGNHCLKSIPLDTWPGFPVVSGRRINLITATSSWPEAEVPYFLNTKVFPKLGCIQSSEQLIKIKIPGLPPRNSDPEGCLGPCFFHQLLEQC